MLPLATPLAVALLAGAALAQVDVPLRLFTSPTWPNGVPVGLTNGIAFGDYDADGWVDVYAAKSSNLWRNVRGRDWQLVAVVPLPPSNRYSAAFGDYDRDGFPDIAVEPRADAGDGCFRLLRNLGGSGRFRDVAADPSILSPQPCNAFAETVGWGDVDGDGELDLFLPLYRLNGHTNELYHNRGPTGPGGAHRFVEVSTAAGVDNTAATGDPEGVQLADVDFDGDLDLYTNGKLHQNVSAVGVPRFLQMAEAASGILFSGVGDEGAALFDYDLDGDLDLVVAYISGPMGIQLYENRGDGTFFQTRGSIESRFTGLGLGLSAEDWDNDGDIDLTTRHVFRRNLLVETGQRFLRVATHAIPNHHIGSATPAWADWDRDGDLDCALGNWLSTGNLYENTTYSAATPPAARRHVRVRAVADAATAPRGLETEFGAAVELRLLRAAADGRRRRKFTASSAGYLNQNDYTLHFALPSAPPIETLRFDVVVDFPGNPVNGIRRVDKHVNPALGNVSLAALRDREIVVFRSGKVRLAGCDFPPSGDARMTTVAALALATASAALPAPVAAAADEWIGLAVDTPPGGSAVILKEIVLDGELAAPAPCGGFNVALWDVTSMPRRVAAWSLATSPRNRRSYLPTETVLQPGRSFRLVARVARRRGSPFTPNGSGAVRARGGLRYTDPTPCSPAGTAGAAIDPLTVGMALRYSLAGPVWTDLGHGLAGSAGVPVLTGTGSLAPSTPFGLAVAGARANAPLGLVIGTRIECAAVLGGTLVPSADVLLGGSTDGTGAWTIGAAWPAAAAAGVPIHFQAWLLDPGAAAGAASSNALSALGR